MPPKVTSTNTQPTFVVRNFHYLMNYSHTTLAWLLCLIAINCFFTPTKAQNITAELNSLAGTKGQLPFWLWANQLGRFQASETSIQNLNLTVFHTVSSKNKQLLFDMNADLDMSTSKGHNLYFTQLFANAKWKFLYLRGGLFADKVMYQGLSSTNGNLAASLNARPHPKIRAGFSRFVALGKGFSVKGFYEEGILNDERYVKNTHLHRKALFLRFGRAQRLQVTAGLNHFVMWWGTHPTYGELQGPKYYIDYVTSDRGGETALPTDQGNVMGNSYGSYHLEIKKEFETFGLTGYINHPFDDHSGMELENYRDNLYGLLFSSRHATPHFKNLLFEYHFTKNQSGPLHLFPLPNGTHVGHGRDDYFNHGVYRSGVTYQQMSMASPLFYPLKIENGISMGFENTRISGFHLAANGFLKENMKWESKLTYTNNFGKYGPPQMNGQVEDTYSPPRKQISSVFTINWISMKHRYSIGATLAADKGNLFDNSISKFRMGARLSLRYKLVQSK